MKQLSKTYVAFLFILLATLSSVSEVSYGYIPRCKCVTYHKYNVTVHKVLIISLSSLLMFEHIKKVN